MDTIHNFRLYPPQFAERDVMERAAWDHSGLMLAALITLPHFSVSAVMSFAKSLGEPGKAVPPSSVSRALILESARLALISALSLSTISVDVFLGVPTPYHWLASKPGRNSPIVGMPGSVSERVALATASARSLPVLMCYSDTSGEMNMTCTCPLSRSVIAGAAPR